MAKHSLIEPEAIRLDYEENWKQKRVLFRDQVRCIANLYIFLLGRFPTENSKKILINCMESPEDEVTTTTDGFTEVSVQLDIDSYFSLSNLEKKRLILEIINEGIVKVANEYSWEQVEFNRITAEIKERNYVNEYVWAQKSSPDRKYKAEVFCTHDIDCFTATLNIRDKRSGGFVKSKKVLQERPHELVFTQYLGSLKWVFDRTVVITYRCRTTQWLVEKI
ncbi:hypothetical protein [Bacillus sp. ISL-37]|jgi:hypothetical protein|uniref:hypothetical protein n=1 Tax=Bacillus sp. ISL-37 TaxID=2819123 RepID=UPI001BE7C01B|nr:hypothetical protein [Bacillus sp. ISL-37]MBT2684529.1 hypothetical protein [Bacillus sp. ISL-37]